MEPFLLGAIFSASSVRFRRPWVVSAHGEVSTSTSPAVRLTPEPVLAAGLNVLAAPARATPEDDCPLRVVVGEGPAI